MLAGVSQNPYPPTHPEKEVIEAGMGAAAVMAAPLQAIGAAVGAACEATTTTQKVCKAIAAPIEAVKRLVPEGARRALGERKDHLQDYLERDLKIPQEDVEFFFENFEAVGFAAAAGGAGSALRIATKPLQEFSQRARANFARERQKKQTTRFPEIDNVVFDPNTAERVTRPIALRKDGKTVRKKSHLAVEIVRGKNGEGLFFVHSLWDGITPISQAMRDALIHKNPELKKKFNTGAQIRAKKAIEEMVRERGMTRAFVQFSVGNDTLFSRVINKPGNRVFTPHGEHPFYWPLQRDPNLRKQVHIDPTREPLPNVRVQKGRGGACERSAGEEFVSNWTFPVFEMRISKPSPQIPSGMSVYNGMTVGALMKGLKDSVEEITECNDRLLPLPAEADWFWGPQGGGDYETAIHGTQEEDALEGGDYEDDIHGARGEDTLEGSESAPPANPPEQNQRIENRAQSARECAEWLRARSEDVDNLCQILALKDHKAAARVQAVGQSSIKIGLALAGVLGGMTNPVSALLAIGGGVAQIAQAFGNQRAPDQYERRMLETIYQQMQRLHQRLDCIEENQKKQFALSLEGFHRVLTQTHENRRQLVRNEERVDEAETKIRSDLERVQSVMQALRAEMHNLAKERLYSELCALLFLISDEEEIDKRRFKERIDSLRVHAVQKASSRELAGQPLPFSTRPVDFAGAIQKLYCDLVPDSARRGTAFVANPSYFVLASLGALYLTLRQYPSLEGDLHSRISRRDVTRLEKLLTEGAALKQTLLELQAATTVGRLVAKYEESFRAFSSKIAAIAEREQKKLEEHYNVQSRRLHSEQGQSLADKEAFSQKIPDNQILLNPPGGNWFSNIYGIEAAGNWGNLRFNPGDSFCKAPYLSAIQHEMAQKKESYLATRREGVITSYANRTSLLKQTQEVVSLQLPWYIHPRDPNLPLLPVSGSLHSYLSPLLKRALASNLGSLRFEYELAGDNFSLSFLFVPQKDLEPFVVHTLQMDYDPKFYRGSPEAPWWYWVGGAYPASTSGVQFSCGLGNSGPKGNALTGYAIVPQRVQQQGKIETYREGAGPRVQEANRERLQRILHEEQGKRYKILMDKLVLEIQSGEAKESKEALDRAYQHLAGYLSLCFRDQIANPELGIGEALKGLQHAETWVTALKTPMKVEPLRKIGMKGMEGLRALQRKLGRCTRQEPPKSNFSDLDQLLELLEGVVEIYRPRAVRSNRWYVSQEAEEAKDATLEGLATVLQSALQETSRSGSISHEKLTEVLQRHLAPAQRRIEGLPEEEQRAILERFAHGRNLLHANPE